MDMYKKASRKKLRFETSKGLLAVEQLWDLTLEELDTLAVDLEEKVETSSARSFLTERSTINIEAQLRFDIALDILQTKITDRDRALAAAETRAKRQRIAEIIARKKDSALEDLPIEELEGMLDG